MMIPVGKFLAASSILLPIGHVLADVPSEEEVSSLYGGVIMIPDKPAEQPWGVLIFLLATAVVAARLTHAAWQDMRSRKARWQPSETAAAQMSNAVDAEKPN